MLLVSLNKIYSWYTQGSYLTRYGISLKLKNVLLKIGCQYIAIYCTLVIFIIMYMTWRWIVHLKGPLRTPYMTTLKLWLHHSTIYCLHDIYWIHIWPDMAYQWNSGYVSEMFCFVTYQYQLNISPKTGQMEESVVSIFYMRFFDDICYRYCRYSTHSRV